MEDDGIDSNAVSQVVSTMITLMVTISAVGAIMLWGLPYIEEKQMKAEFQNVLSGYNIMYDTINSLIISGSNSKGTATIVSSSNKGQVRANPSEDKMVLAYTFEGTYDFNVSGLEDEDNEFTIKMEPASQAWSPAKIESIKVHWLDPSQEISLEKYLKSYKKVYSDQIVAQSFTSSDTYMPSGGWKLSTIKLYIGKKGYISTNLNVSIYDNDPALQVPKDKISSNLSIPAANITNDYSWIECNFSSQNIKINATDKYYVVLNSQGGGYGDGTYDFYKWYLYNENIYTAGEMYYNEGVWKQESNYDLRTKIYFKQKNPPVINSIPMTGLNVISGVQNYVKVNATDADDGGDGTGDDLYFMIDWGDGNTTEWEQITNYDSGYYESDAKYHIWNKTGNYTLNIQLKDSFGLFSEEDYEEYIDVDFGNYFSDDILVSTSYIINPDYDTDTWDVTIPDTNGYSNLNGTVRIDLFNDSQIPFGRIWIFPLGLIEYTSTFGNSGQQTARLQNGYVISKGSFGNSFQKEPAFINENKKLINPERNFGALALRIIQLEPVKSIGISGKGEYKFDFTMRNSYSREPGIPRVHSIKLFFYGDETTKDVLFNYYLNRNFARATDYETDPWGEDMVYFKFDVDAPVYLVLDNSFIEVDIR